MNRQIGGITIALMLIASVYTYRLDKPFLWCDEADVGIFSRNVLTYGYPTAFDGRNIPLFDGCSQLSKSLLSARIPWAPYYLGAISLKLFGDNPRGLRLIFTFIGMLAFFPIYSVLKTQVPYSVILSVLLLTSPQILLFSRNARYYPLLILLYSILTWHMFHEFKNNKKRILTGSLCFVLFFHSHPVAAACSAISILIFCLINRKKLFITYLIASGIGFLSWLSWYKLIGPHFFSSTVLLKMISTNFSGWFERFVITLKVSFLDLDSINCLPLILWGVLLSVGLIIRKKETLYLIKSPLIQFIFISLFIHIFMIAGCFGYETGYKYSMLRFMPHIITWAFIPVFITIKSYVGENKIFLICCGLILCSNLLTLSYWTKPKDRYIPFSWWALVYSEIYRAQQDGWHKVIKILKNERTSKSDNDKTVLVHPVWLHLTAVYHLGDQYLIMPPISKKDSDCDIAIRKNIGEESFEKFTKRPTWIIDFFREIKPGPDYQSRDIKCFRDWPDDGVRPELVRHTFQQSDNKSCMIRLHKLLN